MKRDETERQCARCLLVKPLDAYGRYLGDLGKVYHARTCGECIENPPVSVQVVVERSSGKVETLQYSVESAAH